MYDSFYQLKRCNQSKRACLIPQALFHVWKMKREIPHNISFGTKIKYCKFFAHQKEHEILVSNDIWEELCIPFENDIHIIVKDRTLFLGPLIGIFTAGLTPPPNQFDTIQDNIVNLISTDHETKGYYYLFGPHHVDWEAAEIHGTFNRNNSLTQHKVPLPNVIYDRIPNRKIEQQHSVIKMKKKFQFEYMIPWFNPGFFDTVEISKQLRTSDKVKKYIPECILEPNTNDVIHLLKSYQHVFVKPSNANGREGINQIIKDQKEPFYYYRFKDKHSMRLRRYTSINKLLQAHFPHGFKQKIIQQGINLVKKQDQVVEFRVHLNKDGFGNWHIPSIIGRTNEKFGVNNHINRSGDILSVTDMLETKLLSKKMITNMKECALLLSKEIENYIPGYIGELGLNIGIDKEKKIWLLEALSKPNRLTARYPKHVQVEKYTKELLRDYALFLAKNSITDPETSFPFISLERKRGS